MNARVDLEGGLVGVRRAAEAGRPLAMSVLGGVAESGRREESEEWHRRAAEAEARGLDTFARSWQAPEPETPPSSEVVMMAAAALGAMQHGDTATAEMWYLRVAAEGHAESMFSLGVLENHRGSRKKATASLRRAAEAGDPDAMSALGGMLRER